MVVDGRFELIGSDERLAITEAEKAAKAHKISISLSEAHLESQKLLAVHLHADRLPTTTAARRVTVLLAVADEKDESHVMGGENGGRTLRHVAVLRRLKRVGSLDQVNSLSQDVRIGIPRGNGGLRLIAFAQDEENGTIWGVASTRFSK